MIALGAICEYVKIVYTGRINGARRVFVEISHFGAGQLFNLKFGGQITANTVQINTSNFASVCE